jgi:hypothetical protein
MANPTEKEKKEKKTSHKHMGKLLVGGKEIDMEITTETTPNANGGYDTVVQLPQAHPVIAKAQQPGG